MSGGVLEIKQYMNGDITTDNACTYTIYFTNGGIMPM